MAKFELEVSKTYIYTGRIEVDADNIEEARRIAFSKIDEVELSLKDVVEGSEKIDGYQLKDLMH